MKTIVAAFLLVLMMASQGWTQTTPILYIVDSVPTNCLATRSGASGTMSCQDFIRPDEWKTVATWQK